MMHGSVCACACTCVRVRVRVCVCMYGMRKMRYSIVMFQGKLVRLVP